MKKVLLLIINLLIFNILTYSQVNVQTGDLLFVGLPINYRASQDSMSGAIADATGKEGETNYIHVAILEVDSSGDIWIIDATTKHGVDRHPIDTFYKDFRLKDGSLPQLDVMRLKNNRNAGKYVENAKKYCGLGYDVYFLPKNNLFYCSELVRESYIKPNGRHIFKAAPMNFKADDGTYPAYWVKLFAKIGQEIPQGVEGTNPNSMSRERCLNKVGKLQ